MMKRGIEPPTEIQTFEVYGTDDDFATKRPRTVVGPCGFSDGSFDLPAELQLDALLAANESGGKNVDLDGKGKRKGSDAKPQNSELLTTELRVVTTRMDFSKLTRDGPCTSVDTPKGLVDCLMTPEHRQLLTEETGACAEWAPDEGKVLLTGSAEQVKRAQRLLSRVTTHCHWGKSETKVRRLLKPKIVELVQCRLSPMNTLRPAEKLLSGSRPLLTIGKDKGNDVVIQDALVSRAHCVVELDAERGAVYILDCSTNGTFLNGIRLPSKQLGKVLLSHGDELLLKDPLSGEQEFGYIVNLNELHVRPDVKLEAPRRLLTAEEMANVGRDFA